jgi:hypothetical protein
MYILGNKPSRGIEVETCNYEGGDLSDNGQTPASVNTNHLTGYIQPAGEKPSWILWFTEKGDGFLYTNRSYERRPWGGHR